MYVDLISDISNGAYKPPNRKTLRQLVLARSGLAKLQLKDEVTSLIASGVKFGCGTDVWSSGDISLNGGAIYYINEDCRMQERIFMAEPFMHLTHTALNITNMTLAALRAAGFPEAKTSSAISSKVHDHAPNVVNGMNNLGSEDNHDLPGSGCYCHKLELSAKSFLGADGVKDVVKKSKGTANHFAHARGKNGLPRFRKIQEDNGFTPKNPQKGSATRWSGAYDQMEFNREFQVCIQLYDLENTSDDVYNKCKYDVEDWTMNEEACAVLAPIAFATKWAEGTNYATKCAYLPMTYALIDATEYDAPVVYNFKGTEPKLVAAALLTTPTRDARELMHRDLIDRFVAQVEGTSSEIDYWIALFLDPQFNHGKFTSERNVPAAKIAWGLEQLRALWAREYKPTPEVPDPAPATEAGANVQPPKKAKTTTSLFGLLAMTQSLAAPPPPVDDPAVEVDELEMYLARPQLTVTENFNVLKWWRAHTGVYPHLVKMVRNVLGCPLSSAGVERLFSDAGRMYSDEQQQMRAELMKAVLFAATLDD